MAILTLILVVSAIYFKDVFAAYINGTTPSIVFGIGLILGVISIIWSGSANRRIIAAIYTIPSIILLTFATTGTLNTSAYYLAIPAALIVGSLAPKLLLRILLLIFAINIFIQIWEYILQSYFFVYEAPDGMLLDEKMFGGLAEVFRAKGIFQGPLSAVAFSIWIALICRGNLAVVFGLFLCAFLASGRLGIITSIFLFAVSFVTNNKQLHHSSKSMFKLLTTVIGSLLLVMAFSDEARITFIASALDSSNDQNQARIYFWLASIDHYLSLSPLELIFGRFGYIAATEGGTENDFLRLLLDCGLAGLTVYVAALAAMFIKAKRDRDTEGMISVGLIILLMNLFPFIQSLGSSFLFWIYVMFKLSSKNRPQYRTTGSTA